jgi:hypothetical protein
VPVLVSRTGGGYHPRMGHNVHDIEQPPVAERKLWATLHSWERSVPDPFPTEQNQVGEQLATRAGASVSFPVAREDGLRFIALWHDGALLWRSAVFLCPAGRSAGLALNFMLPPEGEPFKDRVVDPRCSTSPQKG